MTRQGIYTQISAATHDRTDSLTYTEVPSIPLWLELKKDVRERYGVFYDPKDLPEILSYISHWSPSPDFVINLTFNKQNL